MKLTKTVEFLSYLRSLGVNFSADGGKLRCNAAPGILTSTLRQEIAERKTEILELLQEVQTTQHSLGEPIKPSSREQELPLSFAQQRLWFIEKTGLTDNAYNMPLTLHLVGELDKVALQQSLDRIIARHETLRTTFSSLDGEGECHSPLQMEVSNDGEGECHSPIQMEVSNDGEGECHSPIQMEVSNDGEGEYHSPIQMEVSNDGEGEYHSPIQMEVSNDGEGECHSPIQMEVSNDGEGEYHSPLQMEVSNDGEGEYHSPLQMEVSNDGEGEYHSPIQMEVSNSTGITPNTKSDTTRRGEWHSPTKMEVSNSTGITPNTKSDTTRRDEWHSPTKMEVSNSTGITPNTKSDTTRRGEWHSPTKMEVSNSISVTPVNNKPVQVIRPPFALVLPLQDLSELTPAQQKIQLQQLLQKENEQLFNLEVDPPIRARLFQLGDTEHVLLITLHHIASDGWSLNVLTSELSNHYTAAVTNQPSPLPELPIQYADFAVWQRDYLQGKTLETQIDYWRQKLKEIPQLQLPKDYPRPAVESFKGAGLPINLSPSLTSKLKQLTQKQGVTLFMTLLAGFKVLLHRYSGQEKIAVGSPIANRNRSEIEGLIGFFVNSLVMYTDLEGEPSFTEVLNRVRKTALEAYAHQDLPFEKLVEELQPERSLSKNPLFQVSFAVQQSEVMNPSLSLPNLKLDRYEEVEAEMTVRMDLELHFWPVGDKIEGFCAYNKDLFEAETINRMLSHYQNLLSAAVENPELPIAKLPLMSQTEQQQLLIEWNNTKTDYPDQKCIHELFESIVETTPDAVAVAFGAQKLTYSQLNTKANQLAHYLQKLGVGPEVLVGICIERSVDLIIGILSILKAGGAYVPLDPTYPQDRLSYMFNDSQVSVLLTQEHLLAQLPPHQAQVVCLDRDESKIATEIQENLTTKVTPENLAYTIYTSGSTGKPKGVLLAHQGLCNLAQVQIKAFKVGSNSRVLQFASISFDASIWEIVMAICSGASLYLDKRDNLLPGENLSKLLDEKKITHVTLPPSALGVMPQEKLPALKTIVVAGEACSRELISQWSQGRQFVNAYGPTESTVCATMAQCSEESGAIAIGRPIANTTIYILDGNLQPVPIGVPGEIHIGGIGLARGYLNRPELTLQKFIPNPFINQPEQKLYRTGDLGRYLPDGNIEFLGRIDHQVKIRGFRIEIGEIEATLTQNSTVKETVVVAREDTPGNQRLVAYIVPENETNTNSNQELSETQLNNWQELFNQQIYSQLTQVSDPLFNAKGWLSNYDSQPIPEAQMRVWANDIAGQVLGTNPEKVWEIGCGSGMLLFQIAPHTEVYYGTDISDASLEYIRRQIAEHSDKYAHVTLAQKAATEMADVSDDSFDVVLLNSIVQYFPSIDYLLEVIENSIRVVKPGGSIVLGDIRNFPLMEAFQTSVQLYKATPSLSVKQLTERIDRFIQQEKELLVSPEFFVALKQKYPEITHVQMRLQKGRELNELNKYRYSVLLHIEAQPKSVIEAPTYEKTGISAGEIEAYLKEKQPESICFSNLVNSRIATDVAALELRSQSESQLLNVQQLRQQLDQQSLDGVDPEELHELSAKLGYKLELCWSPQGKTGYVDAVFVRNELATEAIVLTPLTQKLVVSGDWDSYGNNPLQAQAAKQLIPQWREYLEQRLPDYMVPSGFVVLPQLPLTPNGKIDRKALPAPDNASSLSTDFVAPQTATQQTLVEIWAQVLGIKQVGIHDNFFDLGGHSLLATQLISCIRQSLHQNVSLKTLFASPTITQLEQALKLLPIENSLESESLVMPTIVPVPEQRYQPFPLTDVQQAYWLGRNSAFELGNTATHGYLELDCKNLNVEKLSRAWQQVVNHHDMLRAVILPDGQQQVLEQVPPYEIEIIDLSGHSPETVAQELEAIRQEMSHESFPTDKWPLFKICATRLKENLYRLHWSFDALIADAWSMMIFWQQWLQLYYTPETPLPTLEITFRDYVLTELSLKSTPQYQSSQEYWRQRLDSLPPTPELPMVKQTVALQEPEFKSLRSQLSARDWQKLKQKAQQASLTPSGVLLAAFADILTYWSTSPKFTINLTLFNRWELHPEVNQLVGDFTSLTLLEVNNSVASSFVERAQRIQSQLWQDLDHRYVSGVEVQRELRRHRGTYQPMGVVFTSTLALDSFADLLPSSESEESSLDDLGELVYMVNKTPQVWLDHAVSQDEQGALMLIWNVVEELFPEGVIDEMFESYQHWLQQLATTDTAWGHTHPQLLPPTQLAQRLEINQTTTSIPKQTLHGLFLEQVALRPDAMALVSRECSLTYRQLSELAHNIGIMLQQSGATPNTLVAVVMDKGWAQVVAVMAILLSGAAYLPIDPTLPEERLKYLLEQGEVKLVLTQTPLVSDISLPDGIEYFCIDSPQLEVSVSNGNSVLQTVSTPDDLAYVIYTSGSTGLPKGVAIDHRGAVNTIVDINHRFHVNCDDRILAISALNFDLSVYDIFGSLAAGATIVMPSATAGKDPAHWVELMVEHQVTVWNTVPALMQMLVEYLSSHPLTVRQQLRLVLLSGDWLPMSLPERLRNIWEDIEVVSLGGATEASIWSIYYPITEINREWTSIPYGKPLSNQSFYVLNHLMEPSPVWVPGQLYIGGVGLALGYWKNQQKTEASFIEHPVTGERLYKTGDLGRYWPDGNIEFLGRVDFQVKINGYRIELGEIEVALMEHPGIAKGVVSVVGEPGGTQRLVSYVVASLGEKSDLFEEWENQENGSSQLRVLPAQKLRSYLKQKLPEYMVPLTYVLLEDLPLTANGKVDRKALPVPNVINSLQNREQVGLLPNTPIQKDLALMLENILEVNQISINNNFFEIGGDSLLATRIVSRIKETFQVDMSLRDFLGADTVKDVADYLEVVLKTKQTLEKTKSNLGTKKRVEF
ncbi:non-ribosomal peptide synthetase [Okeania sp. SIO2B3]|uniref:non-ribosomal peptide synthetase n=1 Tax=Okeania sp. SIO2B3 TaxID=2607784 RepID=UPI0013C2255E|nr:non-ribosomal peptide synthetase [Okeania sp. SIO2B3]NET44009.1 amino acid adenylation domain-containing protein [Okeania sp. SIO2B3]